MALPTIISVAEDALDAVPEELPRCEPGDGRDPVADDLAGGGAGRTVGDPDRVMLGMGRAIGETMAVMMVTGNAARMPLTWTPSSARCAR
jgi:ABC-type phosphate transport system permease subunit